MENSTNDANMENGTQSAQSPNTSNRALDSVMTAVRTGADDARKAAEEAIPKIKSAAWKATYWTAYSVSFAAAFQWALVRAGGSEGLKAGREAAEGWFERIRQRNAAQSASYPALIGPATPDSQTGAA